LLSCTINSLILLESPTQTKTKRYYHGAQAGKWGGNGKNWTEKTQPRTHISFRKKRP